MKQKNKKSRKNNNKKSSFLRNQMKCLVLRNGREKESEYEIRQNTRDYVEEICDVKPDGQCVAITVWLNLLEAKYFGIIK
jgi:hypothetical protein